LTTNDYRRISVFVHGWWGSGKTWFGQSAPGPRLTLDCEGGVYDTPGHHIPWDPRYPIPEIPDDVDPATVNFVVDIQSWAVVQQAIAVLNGGNHPFESVVLDSLSEAQRILKDKIRQALGIDIESKFAYDQWHSLFEAMFASLRELRNLTRPSSAKRVNVVVVCGSNVEALPASPLLQGSLRREVPGLFDMMGYLTSSVSADGEELRQLHIVQSDLAVAKCRLHNVKVRYGASIPHPDMKELLRTVNT
jgi:hypothetical protein